MDSPKKSKEELHAINEARKRLAWIENVKRINNWTQEQAEAAWTKIFNPDTTIPPFVADPKDTSNG